MSRIFENLIIEYKPENVPSLLDFNIFQAEEIILELGFKDDVAIAHSYTTGPTELELLSRIQVLNNDVYSI